MNLKWLKKILILPYPGFQLNFYAIFFQKINLKKDDFCMNKACKWLKSNGIVFIESGCIYRMKLRCK